MGSLRKDSDSLDKEDLTIKYKKSPNENDSDGISVDYKEIFYLAGTCC